MGLPYHLSRNCKSLPDNQVGTEKKGLLELLQQTVHTAPAYIRQRQAFGFVCPYRLQKTVNHLPSFQTSEAKMVNLWSEHYV